MRDVFIGRQAIYNADKTVFGYELLFRGADSSIADFSDGERATFEVIDNALTVFGLDELVGDRPVFINVTSRFLQDGSALTLPPARVVLEVLEDTEVTDALVARIETLKERGFRIALDDYVHQPRLAPLVALADFIKVDLPQYDPAQLASTVADLRMSDARLLAEKVETLDDYEQCRALGFDLFQGFFLSRPDNIRSTDLSSDSLPVMDLFAELQGPGASVTGLQRLIQRNVNLASRLLHCLHDSDSPERADPQSVHDAVRHLDAHDLRRWTALMLLASATHGPSEIAMTMVVRARFSEHLARGMDAAAPETAFMAGLLSGLDLLLDAPMEAILKRLPLESRLRRAISDHDGPEGTLLSATIAFERGQYAPLLALDIHADVANAAYLDAIRWAETLRAQW